MRYRLAMPEPHSHLFEVEMEVDRPGDAIVLAMPVWTPGSYLVREFARHVERLRAEDGEGRALPVERLDKRRFRVRAAGAARVRVRYAVYAHELTVRTSHLDGTHGYFNGANVFFAVEGREGEPHRLAVDAPAGWRVATALAPAEGGADPLDPQARSEGPWRFEAPDFDALVDSPVEVGTHALARFEVAGVPHALALWGRGEVDLPQLAADTRRIVEELWRLMAGRVPYRRYLFIVHLDAGGRGGLEHASSASLLVRRSGFFPRDAYEETLALVAHELFHAWNVKALRPAALRPYRYGEENYTRLLWWFEGVTSYYDSLALVRAGLVPAGRYLRHLGEELTALARLPGAGKMSLEEASFTAWVKYYRPDENSPNSAVSYYQKGELVALALDLLLRGRGSSLDALVRTLVDRHAASGLPEDGVERAVAELAGEREARAFFDAHVRGVGRPELGEALAGVGVALRRRAAQGLDDKGGTPPSPPQGEARPQPGFLGAALGSGAKLTVTSVREGSPAHRAGLYAGDEIVAEGGFRVDRAALWTRLQERGPGGSLRLHVFRRDELLEVVVPLAAAPEDTVWLEASKEATAAQRAAFQAWCGVELPG